MTLTMRSLLLWSACALSVACGDTQAESPRPKPPTALSAPAPEPKLALTQTEPMLAATAPAAPSTILDKPVAPKSEETKPSGSVGVDVKDAATLAAETQPADALGYDRPLDPAEVALQRFVLARGVDQREPVDESDRFRGDEKIFAFMQFANPETAPFAFRVHWEPLSGPASAYGVKLKVETAARYRTWSWTAIPREPGQYRAVLRTLDGKELASKPFTIE